MNLVRLRFPSARRVAIVSDTHGVLDADVDAALAGADLVVHAGDVGGPAVVTALMRHAPLAVVAGNNDTPGKWPHTAHAQLAALPEALDIALPGGSLVVVHGHQWPRAGTRHAKLRARWPAARAIVYGHSHRRIVDNDHAPWVLNPGAAGRARTYGGASWLGLAVDRDCWQVAEGEFPRDTGARRAAVSRINEEEGR